MEARPFRLHLAAALLAACGSDGGVGSTPPVPEAGVPVGSPFACGPYTCQPGDYCSDQEIFPPTPPLSDIYNCSAFPPACLTTPTCACLAAAQGFNDWVGCDPQIGCTDSPKGYVIVMCDAP